MAVSINGTGVEPGCHVARQSEMRAVAKIAFLRADIHSKLKAALRRAPGGQSSEFCPGEMVYFWSPVAGAKKRRYKADAGAWRGPAVVLVPDGRQKFFISWRGRCVLVAGSNLKPASLDASGDHDLRLREAEAATEKGYGFVDLTGDVPPAAVEEEAVVAPQTAGLRVRRARNGMGRRVSEARKTMQNLKSVRKMLKLPLERLLVSDDDLFDQWKPVKKRRWNSVQRVMFFLMMGGLNMFLSRMMLMWIWMFLMSWSSLRMKSLVSRRWWFLQFQSPSRRMRLLFVVGLESWMMFLGRSESGLMKDLQGALLWVKSLWRNASGLLV